MIDIEIKHRLQFADGKTPIVIEVGKSKEHKYIRINIFKSSKQKFRGPWLCISDAPPNTVIPLEFDYVWIMEGDRIPAHLWARPIKLVPTRIIE